MANIKVVYDGLFIGVPGLYHELLNLDSLTLDGVIQAMVQRHGARFKEVLYDQSSGEIASGVSVLINGGFSSSTQSQVKEADEVAFLMPIAGGALSHPEASGGEESAEGRRQ